MYSWNKFLPQHKATKRNGMGVVKITKSQSIKGCHRGLLTALTKQPGGKELFITPASLSTQLLKVNEIHQAQNADGIQ